MRLSIFFISVFSILFSVNAEKRFSNLDLYLCIGQSNMAGRGRLSAQYMDTLKNVYLFNDVNTFEPAVNPLNRYSNIRKDISMQGMGPSYSMAKELAAESGRKIGIIVNARGGNSIDSWLKGSMDGYYEKTMTRLRQALKYGTLKAIVWHQGETDCHLADGYMAKLSRLINDFRTDLQLPELPVVVGEIAKWNWPLYENKPMGTEPLNNELRKVISVIPNSFCVSSEGLSMLSNEKDPHFSAEAQLELGKRYANALIQSRHSVQPSKPVYNAQAKALDRMLKQLVKDRKVMFGMANPTTIGFSYGPVNYDIESSDCKDITGDNPAFHESDFMWYQQDTVFWENDVKAMKAAWRRGAVIGYCWHLKGPRSGKFSVGDGSSDYYLAQEILSNPDRSTNPMLDWFLDKCDEYVIPVFKELDCPVVFRPFHEMTGGWFWWGKQIGAENYRKLFRLTVDYIRSKDIDNVLYSWSPDKFADFSYYPGDDYVDVIGLDIYEPGLVDYYPHEKLIENLQKICDYAEAHDKIAAWTEVGCRPISNEESRYPELYPDFWTKYVFDIVRDNPKAGRVAWISSWYNADWGNKGKASPYIPYKGMKKKNSAKAIKDFRKMYAYPFTIFEKEMLEYRKSFNL